MSIILLAQLFAHFVADFFAQPECVCEKKQKLLLSSWHIYVHAIVVFVVSLAFTFTCDFVFWAGIIAVVHFGMDAVKVVVQRRLSNSDKKIGGAGSPWLFFTDQIAHIAVIYVAVGLYLETGGHIPGYLNAITTHGLMVATGLVLCLKPANILIRECLSTLKTNRAIEESLENEGLQRAGRWIGSMERAMTFGVAFALGVGVSSGIFESIIDTISCN